jgi:hypothetical protein
MSMLEQRSSDGNPDSGGRVQNLTGSSPFKITWVALDSTNDDSARLRREQYCRTVERSMLDSGLCRSLPFVES